MRTTRDCGHRAYIHCPELICASAIDTAHFRQACVLVKALDSGVYCQSAPTTRHGSKLISGSLQGQPWTTIDRKVRNTFNISHGDVIKWKHIPRYWPFVREIRRSPMNSPHKASDAELFFNFIWSTPEQTVEKTVATPVVWDAIALIMTSL